MTLKLMPNAKAKKTLYNYDIEWIVYIFRQQLLHQGRIYGSYKILFRLSKERKKI